MIFKENQLFHVYNRGNNREKIFHSRANYLLFLKKTRDYILPYSEIIAWCLMPNHFHFLILVHRIEKDNITLNYSIGRMLSSYTRTINKHLDRKGSLFQKHTKAVNMTSIEKITPAWHQCFGVTVINRSIPEREYPKLCMDYIHANPVTSGIVYKEEDWEFSSIHEYLGMRKGTLINMNTGEKIRNPT